MANQHLGYYLNGCCTPGWKAMPIRKNVFISHHHRDDAYVDRLSGMLSRAGHDIRNSSIRAKPANQRRLDAGLVKERTIKRLLRMKMRWASTVIVLIGADTHSRPWVNWEIEMANRLNKRIVGVYAGGTEAEIPEAFERYGDALVSWRSDSLANAIEGVDSPFQNPDGSPRGQVHEMATSRC